MTDDSSEQVLNTQIQYRLIEALSSSEARYQLLLNSLSEVVFSLDEKGCFSILNKAWEEHTGFGFQDCLGKSLQDFMPAAEYTRFQNLLAVGDFRDEFQFISNLGHLLWFDVKLSWSDDNCHGTMVCINERKQSASMLKNTEQQFRLLVESLAEILFQIDGQLRIRFLNPAWREITGFETAKSLDCSLLEYIEDDDSANLVRCWFDNPVDEVIRQELRLRCQNDSFRWVSAQARVVVRDGQPLITGAMLDIHDRKLMEATLRCSEERYGILASSTTDGIWDWDLNTDQVYFSPRWKSMLGYEDDELENSFSTWYTRVHPEDIRLAMDEVMACLEGGKPVYENVHRMQHRQGHWLWILDRGIALRDNKGLPYRMVGSHADVTGLKITEQALQRRERELEAVVNISPDGIVTVSPQGVLQSVNPAFVQMTGFDPDKLIGMTEQEFDNLLQQISEQQSFAYQQASPNGAVYCIDPKQLRHHPFQRKGLTRTPTSHSHQPKLRILSRTERYLHSDDLAKVMYFRDISVEREVDQMKSQFLSTAAHELRTPMASVFGFSELLLSRNFDAVTTREILGTIHQQSESLVTMLNQLLDLARIEARMGMDFSFKRQPLSPIIQRVCSELLVPGDERCVNVTLPRKEYWVDVDADKLRLVISNVLVNAYKYSPSGGNIMLNLKARPASDGSVDEIGIVIRDQGLGMSKEQLKHVFERFWRANPVGEIAGTGLGMSLVKEIMDIHFGRIAIKSKPGIGTTVSLWLRQVPAGLGTEDE